MLKRDDRQQIFHDSFNADKRSLNEKLEHLSMPKNLYSDVRPPNMRNHGLSPNNFNFSIFSIHKEVQVAFSLLTISVRPSLTPQNFDQIHKKIENAPIVCVFQIFFILFHWFME